MAGKKKEELKTYKVTVNGNPGYCGERTYHLEEQMALQEEKMKVANHRISDLEERVN